MSETIVVRQDKNTITVLEKVEKIVLRDILPLPGPKGDKGDTGSFGDYGKGFITHDDDPNVERPVGYASIEWRGSVEPLNAIEGDTWIRIV